jgi:hypothetical protein
VSATLARSLAVVWLAFVVSGDHVVGLLAESRAKNTPLRIEAKLSARDSSAPTQVVIELHPELGARISDDKGGRWLVANGRAVAGTQMPAPAWLPDLAPLVLRRESELRAWIAAEGIDLARNELARCGDADCWVLGTRQGPAQLWVEKSALELRRVVGAHPARVAFDDWREFGKIRFPAKIEIADASGPPAAILAVANVTAITLGPGDLSPAWVQAPPAPKAR